MNVRAYPALVLAVTAGLLACTAHPWGQPERVQATNSAPGVAQFAPVAVEAQPLAANIQRVIEALESLGTPLPADLRAELTRAGRARDAKTLQERIDARVLLAVHINPEARVKVARGPGPAALQQAGYTPVLVKIVNESRGTQRLRIGSPQSGPVYAGMSRLAGTRMQQQHLRENENVERRTDRFLDLEMFTAPPMTPNLSGLDVEYAVALVYSSEAGRREATITFDVGQGTQDLGFRAEVPVLFEVKPAVAVTLRVLDHDGTPTTGRFQFVDEHGHVFPPQAKRLAPDLFFQKQIYRSHGEQVLLPPGRFTMFYGRGPEYRWAKRAVTIPAAGPAGAEIAVRLERWVDPGARGFYSGDHHIHASGCAHYTSPTEGVDPADMFRQVKGEGLNVGSVLTWGPGFDHQRQFFAPAPDKRSEPMSLMKYDIEVSGFGSEALGHVVLLDLKEQIYPGANGSKGWPSWTLPVLRWTKAQGGVTGYAHSGSGLQIDPAAATARLLGQLDTNKDGRLAGAEAALGLLPESFAEIDTNRDGVPLGRGAEGEPRPRGRSAAESRHPGAQQRRGAGDLRHGRARRHRFHQRDGHRSDPGMERVVPLDEQRAPRQGERRNGFPVHERHPRRPGAELRATREAEPRGLPAVVQEHRPRPQLRERRLRARVGFRRQRQVPGRRAPASSGGQGHGEGHGRVLAETPLEPAYGGVIPVGGPRHVGDTVIKRETQSLDPVYQRGRRLVEVVVNGRVAASREVPADGREHAVEFQVPIERSSWVAVRQFPQLHTNPVNVLVAGQPIRASRASARWAIACIDQLWRMRARQIAPGERADAEKAYEEARAIYRRIAAEAPADR